MKKPSFEEWKNHYYDVPFIKENYDLLESMQIPIDCILPSQEVAPTRSVRVFTFGSWYEILKDNRHYILVCDFEYIGEKKEEIEKGLKELYNYVISKNVTKNLFN
tara:strand:- start:866 stop:1180 length:315 start_codon:yes stop_codon:yes gene_type:complete